jgi:hypothetical protein
MEYQYILNTILIFFTSTHWKISSIGAFLHNSFAGRMWPAGRSLENLGLDNVEASTSHNPVGLHCLLQG